MAGRTLKAVVSVKIRWRLLSERTAGLSVIVWKSSKWKLFEKEFA